jgi:hypothetical protein
MFEGGCPAGSSTGSLNICRTVSLLSSVTRDRWTRLSVDSIEQVSSWSQRGLWVVKTRSDAIHFLRYFFFPSGHVCSTAYLHDELALSCMKFCFWCVRVSSKKKLDYASFAPLDCRGLSLFFLFSPSWPCTFLINHFKTCFGRLVRAQSNARDMEKTRLRVSEREKEREWERECMYVCVWKGAVVGRCGLRSFCRPPVNSTFRES